jgi:hypothetical protein
MVSGIKELARSAERIRWDPANQDDIVEAEALLRDIGPQRLIAIALPVIQHLIETEGALFEQVGISPSIRPTPTHDKFLLYGDHLATEGIKLWADIWDKKHPSGDSTPQYAEIPHNHRYRIAATTMDKNYLMRTWRYVPEQELALPPDGLWTPDTEVWLHPEEKRYEPGDAWSLNTLDIHSITPEPGTVSFVIQGPTLRSYSCTFDEVTGEVLANHPDMPTTFDEMLARMQAGTSGNSGDQDVAVSELFL